MSLMPPTLPPPPPPTAPVGPVHQPTVDDREPRTRRKLLFWDRAKVTVLLSGFVLLSAAYQQSQIPIMSFGEALRDQVAAKWWIVSLIGLELVRQLHYLLSERSAGYHQFWTRQVWGRWEARVSKMNPWLRYRIGRFFRVSAVIVVITLLLAWKWGLTFWETLAQAPARLWNNAFATAQGMPMVIYVAFILGMAVMQFVAIFWFMSRGGTEVYMPQEVRTRFSDVWGQDKVLEKVKENIVFLERPEEIEARGGHVPGGILLWGPPGTGKTLMAEAVAGETGRPYVFVDPGAFQNMFFGVGILKVKSLFKKLRKLALRYGGVIVFFDEADSLGNRGAAVAGGGQGGLGVGDPHRCNGLHYVPDGTAQRVQSELFRQRLHAGTAHAEDRRIVVPGLGGAGMGTLQALLTELSGLKKPRGFIARRVRQFLGMPAKQPPKYRLLVMMATNMPDSLDEALLRPGRIDRIYKVDYPSLEGRKRTFEGYLDKVQHCITPAQIERISLMSPRATGAVIKDIVNEALIVAMRNGRDTVTWPDLLEAKSLKTHGMPDEVHPMALERHAVALHEASHAVAMKVLMRRHTIDVATIEPRGPVGGFVSPVPLEEEGFPWRSTEENDVITFLASLAGERFFYDGDNSVGVGGDLRASTMMVYRMLGGAAMGETLSSVGFGPSISQKLHDQLSDQVEAKLKELLDRADRLIRDNRVMVMAVAHALEQHKTITGEDIDAIFAGTRGPIVDGSWYHTEDFVHAYVAYHRAALEAHRTGGRLVMPLPVPMDAMVPSGGSGRPLAAWSPPRPADRATSTPELP